MRDIFVILIDVRNTREEETFLAGGEFEVATSYSVLVTGPFLRRRLRSVNVWIDEANQLQDAATIIQSKLNFGGVWIKISKPNNEGDETGNI